MSCFEGICGTEMKSKSVVEIYREILTGETKKFPKGTWSPSNGGYDSFNRCFRYLILEVLKWGRQEAITNVTDKFLQKYRLYGAMEVLFKYRIYAAIERSFPEWEVKVWEMPIVPKGTWNNKENIIGAVRWLYLDQLKLSREDMVSTSLKFLDEKGFASISDNLPSSENTLFDIMNISFPEYNFKKYEFDNIKTWSEHEVISMAKWFIEEKMDCKNKKDVINKLYHSDFAKHGYHKILMFFDNKLSLMLKSVYPEQDWTEIEERSPKNQDNHLKMMLLKRHGEGNKN